MADGRRMWRIFDNLMNNVCKYAQPETRVYLAIEKSADNAVITFKNTSKEQLDISAEDLMERFTRGDHSRNTEGNGLGLSIAKSLAELQNGSLKLEIDGDLFKAVLRFPVIKS
jgi:signal transduction histidine kinase